MNWTAFFIVLAVVCTLAVVGSLAWTMTAFDFDGAAAGLRAAVVAVTLAVLDAVLIGLAVPS